MKTTRYRIALLLCVVTISIELISCDSSAIKQDETPNSVTDLSSVSNNRMDSNDYGSSSPCSRFIGRYTIQGGDWDCPIEILSDGRVLLISYVIASGEETKMYIGDINIISENAFTIKNASYNVSLCYADTPIYVIRNGVERNIGWTTRGGGFSPSSLVFDISENRAYTEGIQKYRNRDIGEVEYVKFKR